MHLKFLIPTYLTISFYPRHKNQILKKLSRRKKEPNLISSSSHLPLKSKTGNFFMHIHLSYKSIPYFFCSLSPRFLGPPLSPLSPLINPPFPSHIRSNQSININHSANPLVLGGKKPPCLSSLYFHSSPTPSPYFWKHVMLSITIPLPHHHHHPVVAAGPLALAGPAARDFDTIMRRKPDSLRRLRRDPQPRHRRYHPAAIGAFAVVGVVVGCMKVGMVVEILGRSGHWCCCCYCCSDRRGGRHVGPGSCWGFGSGFCPPGIKLLDASTRIFGG